jgi:hypothetical protein
VQLFPVTGVAGQGCNFPTKNYSADVKELIEADEFIWQRPRTLQYTHYTGT